MPEDDAAFLDNYDETKSKIQEASKGSSASERVIHFDMEERAAATGDHVHPDAYAAVARSEGLRADTLMRIFADGMIRVNDQYFRMFEHLSKRTEMLEDKHIEMLDAVRTHYLARAESDASMVAMRAAAEGGEDSEDMQMMKMVLEVLKAQQEAKKNAPAVSPKEKRKRKSRKKSAPLGSID